MLRFSIIASLLLIAAVTIKSNVGTKTESADSTKPLKLSGFSISKPKAKSENKKPQGITSRRTTSNTTTRAPSATTKISWPTNSKISHVGAAPAAAKPPIQSLEPEQKIERAKQAWENIRVKALDHMRVDQSTRERIEELREEYEKSTDPLAYSDYQQNLKDLLGEQSFNFLWKARENFKSRIFQRAQLEIGPHLGEL